LASSALSAEGTIDIALQQLCYGLCVSLLGSVAIKLIAEAGIFAWQRASTFTPLRRTAILMTGDLSRVTQLRFAIGIIGGILFPAFLLGGFFSPQASQYHPAPILALALFLLLLNLAGEILERYLFFAAAVAPKMPGAPCT
jgi:hypothetical protein